MDPLLACPKCGAPVRPDALRCDTCGARTVADPPPAWRVRVVIGVVGALFLAAAAWGVFWAKGQWSSTPAAAGVVTTSTGSASATAPPTPAHPAVTSPQASGTATTVALPQGSRLCDSGGDLRAYAGSPRTSCSFAITVRDAFVGAGGVGDGASRSVRAHSTVTDTTYTMTCKGRSPVTCRGGSDAVIYLLP